MRTILTAPTPAPTGATRICDPCLDDIWAELADRSGSLFHSTAWLRVLRDGYGLRPQALVTTDHDIADPVAGGLAWVEVADARGRRLVSLPFSDFAGPIGPIGPEGLIPLVPERTSAPVPLATRMRLATAGGPDRGAVDPDDCERYRIGLNLAEAGRLAWHWTELPPAGPELGATDGDELWSQLASGARQNIRRSRRSGVRVEVRSDLEALDEYHRLHLGLRKTKYRMLAQPWSFFTAMHQHFGPDRLRVVLARLDESGPGGDAVAGVILLRHGDWAYYKLNASTPAGWPVRANDAVMWEAMVAARRWGCRWFDFGVSDLDQPGLIRYKNKYATGQGEVVVLRRDGGPRPWTARQLDRALPLATRVLTAPQCPDALGRQASQVLYRLFC